MAETKDLDLTGEWTTNIPAMPGPHSGNNFCSIIKHGHVLLLIDQRGIVASGLIEPDGTIFVPEWGWHSKVIPETNEHPLQIEWNQDPQNVWTKVPRKP